MYVKAASGLEEFSIDRTPPNGINEIFIYWYVDDIFRILDILISNIIFSFLCFVETVEVNNTKDEFILFYKAIRSCVFKRH